MFLLPFSWFGMRSQSWWWYRWQWYGAIKIQHLLHVVFDRIENAVWWIIHLCKVELREKSIFLWIPPHALHTYTIIIVVFDAMDSPHIRIVFLDLVSHFYNNLKINLWYWLLIHDIIEWYCYWRLHDNNSLYLSLSLSVCLHMAIAVWIRMNKMESHGQTLIASSHHCHKRKLMMVKCITSQMINTNILIRGHRPNYTYCVLWLPSGAKKKKRKKSIFCLLCYLYWNGISMGNWMTIGFVVFVN